VTRTRLGGTGQITGLGGKCVDVAGATAPTAPRQLYDCNGSTAQRWTVTANGSLQALGKCLDLTGGRHGQRDQGAAVRLQRSGAQKWQKGTGGTW